MDLRTAASGTTSCWSCSTSRARCCRRSAPSSDRRVLRRDAARPAPSAAKCRSAATLGDQQAATRRPGLHRARAKRRTRTAPATSCCSTPGREIVPSKAGLLTTVCYRLGDADADLRARRIDRRDRIGGPVAARSARHHQDRGRDRGARADRRPTTAACTSFRRSPACSRRTGAPTRAARSSDCRASTPAAHLARATLEAICFQTRAVLDAMVQDSGVRLERAEGGRRRNRQRHADAAAGRRPRRAGRPARRRGNHRARRRLRRRPGGGLLEGSRRTAPELEGRSPVGAAMDADQREASYRGWQKAVERTLNWVDVG